MNSLYYTLLLLLLFPHIVHAQNTTCPSGAFQTPDGTCKTCPPGTWREARNRRIPVDRCVPCRSGTFNPLPGAHGRDLCRRCPQLTFSSQPGALKCEACPKGTVSGSGASKCVLCKPGTELKRFPRRGSLPCEPCQKGSYNPNRNDRCQRCPEGQTSPGGAISMTQCTNCPPGEESYFIDPTSGCKPCIMGTFKPGRSGACESCPRGFVSNENRTACTPCPPGTFEPVLGSTCKNCFPNFETRGFGNERCRRIGGSCPKTFFEDTMGDCRACERGFKFNIRKNKCEKCPPGTVSIGGVQALCERCPMGQKPDSENRACECPRGHRKSRLGDCEPCPKGEFGRFPSRFTSCTECSPGTFSDEVGATRCKPCPSGTISSLFRASKCTPCPPGTQNGVGYRASTCLSVTTNCEPGFRRHVVGPSKSLFGCDRVVCKPDNNNQGEIGKTCALCDPDQFLNAKRRRCQDCPEDSISFGGLVTECQKCTKGMIRDPFEASTCSCRATGKGLQSGTCKPCPPGTFSDGRLEACGLCPPGKFANKPGSEECGACPVDTVAAEEGAVRCTKCPEGTIGNRRPRFFLDEDGGTKCINIPA